MQPEYEDLNRLIREDPEAGRYYHSLPDYVREAIDRRAQSVTSFDSLRNYAENLLRNE